MKIDFYEPYFPWKFEPKVGACEGTYYDECCQETRPGYSLCWHHGMIQQALGYIWRPRLHQMLVDMCEELEQEEFRDPDDYSPECGIGTGYWSLDYIEDVREPEEEEDWPHEIGEGPIDDDDGERPTFETLEEAIKGLPDLEDAMVSELDSFGGVVHIYAGKGGSHELVAMAYFHWERLDEEEE